MADFKIAEKDMIRLVEEVSKLDSERQQMLEKSQVAKIMNELSLPSDLLDEALDRLTVKKKNESKQRILLFSALGIALLGIATVVIMMTMSNVVSNEYSKVVGTDARITQDAEGAVKLEAAPLGQMAYVQFTLQSVPQGKQLPLHAKWFKPDGTVFHENNWHTRDTNKMTWNSHAKCFIPDAAPTGKWMVEVSLGGRSVISKIFIVK